MSCFSPARRATEFFARLRGNSLWQELWTLPEPGQPIPMGSWAETLAGDASNVTGLVNRQQALVRSLRRLLE